MSYDFGLEMKLRREAPELQRIFAANVLCTQNMLVRYKAFFPDFTDHTSLHSLEVIAFCNELIADNIEKLNADEIFILLSAAYLHDSGMGISIKDYEELSARLPKVMSYRQEHPEADTADIIRRFHNEFSGKYIEKYAGVFDFPSEKHKWAIVEVARGHRKTDLYDEEEYPREFRLDNGNKVHLPYLAALIRLADELDIARDRNIQFLYDIKDLNTPRDIIEYRKHMAVKSVVFAPDRFIVTIDFSDEEIRDGLRELVRKLRETLVYCADVTERCSPFSLAQRYVEVVEYEPLLTVNT